MSNGKYRVFDAGNVDNDDLFTRITEHTESEWTDEGVIQELVPNNCFR